MAYHVHGTETGVPVLFVHGATDSGVLRHHDDALTASLGVRLIAPDLPGVGQTSPHRHAGIASWVRDATALVDRLGIDTFSVAAHSGGSNYALALAFGLPGRVTRLTLAAPTVGLHAPDLQKFIVSEELISILRFHHWRLYPLIRLAFAFHARRVVRDVHAFMTETMHSFPADTETIIGHPDQYEIFESSFRSGMGNKGEGLYETMIEILKPLGFPLDRISQPVTIFYGDGDDVIMPEVPMRLAAQLPACHARLWPDASHYAFIRRDRWIEFLGAALGEGREQGEG